MKILVRGDAGFICGYLVPKSLEAGREVVGLDGFSNPA
jgi:nucleoside-diphosphate-sugar epimerase